MNDDDLYKKLMSVHPAIKAAWARAESINDVLNDQIKDRRVGLNDAYDIGGGIMATTSQTGAHAARKYLPQGKLEQSTEYEQRVNMTPVFAKTHNILAHRQGALFRNPPTLEGDEAKLYEDFWASCTQDGESMLAFAARISKGVQKDGFFGILTDRMPLPDAVKARGAQADGSYQVTEQEKLDYRYGQPIVVRYDASQIYDIQRDDNGIVWVKLVECCIERNDPMAEPVKVTRVRFVGRVNITTYEIRETEQTRTISFPATSAHGFQYANGQPRQPFVLASAFQSDDGLGRPTLKVPAEADIAATRVLSDLVWTLFVLGNPILTWLTQEMDPDISKKFSSNAGRFFLLKCGNQDRNDEQLAFTQMDATGIDRQMLMYEQFYAKADEAMKENVGQTNAVKEMSGISRAWKFKTGEERLLYLTMREIEHALDQIMDIVAVDLKHDPAKVEIKLNDEFDLSDDAQDIDADIKVLATAEQYKLEESAKAILKGLMLPYAESDEDIKSMTDEIDSAEMPEPEPTPAEQLPVKQQTVAA